MKATKQEIESVLKMLEEFKKSAEAKVPPPKNNSLKDTMELLSLNSGWTLYDMHMDKQFEKWYRSQNKY